jgi:uncharacterized protein YozE (UPF0346 family)
MSLSGSILIDNDAAPLKKLKVTLRKKRLQVIILSVVFTMFITAVTIGFLTSPEYIPYSEDIVSIFKNDNELLIATFSDKVSGYDISSYLDDDNSSYVYHITTWDSIWNRIIGKTYTDNVVLNPNGEIVTSVYYYNTNGTEDILIYGKDQNPNGGIGTLPRLVLAYYALFAVIAAIIFGIIIFVFRLHEKIRNAAIKVFFLPISYILSHICIKGFTSSSYLAARDFFAILLVMIPLYIVFLSAGKLLTEYKNS